VRIHCCGVGQADAVEQVPGGLGGGGWQAVRPIDVEPDLVGRAHLRDRAKGIHRTGETCTRSADDRHGYVAVRVVLVQLLVQGRHIHSTIRVDGNRADRLRPDAEQFR